jgi:two-component system, NarL family, response regulator DegU
MNMRGTYNKNKKGRFMDNIKVLLVDEHQLVMEGIKQILENHARFEVIATTQDGIMALSQLQRQIPDIVLMELHMPHLNGLETCKAITRDYPQVKVIILTSCEVDMYMGEAFRAGARSYLRKTITQQELVAALLTVYETGVLLPSHVAHHVLHVVPHKKAQEGELFHCLTTREREILSLIAEGRTTRDIACSLVISPKTVRNHLSHIYEKLGIQDRLQAVLYVKQLLTKRSPSSPVSA